MNTVAHQSSRGHRTIRLLLSETDDEHFLNDRAYAREQMNKHVKSTAEGLPEEMKKGDAFYGVTERSSKQHLRCRRIRPKGSQSIDTRCPSFVMPDMSGRTKNTHHALFLMRFDVPCWAIAQVFGRNAMYGYRGQQGFSRLSWVGTTVKTPSRGPLDVVADEKQSRRLELDPDDTPETLNTDGWKSTQLAWRQRFPNIALILCFFHADLKVRDRATQAGADVFSAMGDKIWQAYRATTQRSVAQRLRRLHESTLLNVPDSPMKTNVLARCTQREHLTQSDDHPNAYRISNPVDRLMRFMDQAFFQAQYFHGTLASAEQPVRA